MLLRMSRFICLWIFVLIILSPSIPASAQGSGIIPSTPMADGAVVHIVGDGETLAGIAEAYGVSMITIRELNGLAPDSTLIFPGQKLIIQLAPTPTLTPTITPVTPRPPRAPRRQPVPPCPASPPRPRSIR
jgi:hypothetical protein